MSAASGPLVPREMAHKEFMLGKSEQLLDRRYGAFKRWPETHRRRSARLPADAEHLQSSVPNIRDEDACSGVHGHSHRVVELTIPAAASPQVA